MQSLKNLEPTQNKTKQKQRKEKKRERISQFTPALLPFCVIQAAHSAATFRTLKLLFVQTHCLSASSSPSSSSSSSSFGGEGEGGEFGGGGGRGGPSTSHMPVNVTIGWQIVRHAAGTSAGSSSSAEEKGSKVTSTKREDIVRVERILICKTRSNYI